MNLEDAKECLRKFSTVETEDAIEVVLGRLAEYEEMMDAARKIEFPLEPDKTYHFTSISRYINDPSREYYGKWKAGNEEYEHDHPLEAFRAIKEQAK